MTAETHKSLILLEASTGIEPVYTDLQSAASPLRQLAAEVTDNRWAGEGQRDIERKNHDRPKK